MVCSANLRRTNNEPTNCKFNIKLSNESMSNEIGAKYRRRLVVAYPSSFYRSCVVVSFCVVLVAVGIDGRLLVNVETAIRSTSCLVIIEIKRLLGSGAYSALGGDRCTYWWCIMCCWWVDAELHGR